MGGVVAVVEGNAIPGDVELSILKSAKIDRTLPKSHAVGVVADRTGGDVDDFGVVSRGRREIPDELAADL